MHHPRDTASVICFAKIREYTDTTKAWQQQRRSNKD